MFEHRKQPLISRKAFMTRLVKCACLGFGLLAISLYVGMAGYHHIEGLDWIDSYVEAAMILSGMGPVATLHTNLGKFFAGTFALYSGLTFVLTIGVFVAPIVHRFFHKFHLDLKDN